MLDKEKFKRKLLMRALLSAQSMGPFTAGTLALMAMFFIGIKAAPLFFIGVGGIFLGTSWGLKRLLVPSKKITDAIMAEIDREKTDADERMLNDLQRKLQQDGDPRTDTLLSDLRTVMDALRREKGLNAGAGSSLAFGIREDVDKLFKGCVHALHRTLFLREKALGVRNNEIRQRFEADRDAIIEEVEKTIIELGTLHTQAQALGLQSEQDPVSALRSIRESLDGNLRSFEERDRQMKALMDPDHGKEYDAYANDSTTTPSK